MKRLQFLAVLAIAFCLSMPIMMAQSSIMGFSDEASKTQLQLETDYDKLLTATNLDEWMKFSRRESVVGVACLCVWYVACGMWSVVCFFGGLCRCFVCFVEVHGGCAPPFTRLRRRTVSHAVWTAPCVRFVRVCFRVDRHGGWETPSPRSPRSLCSP